jgi:hypothetical protein
MILLSALLFADDAAPPKAIRAGLNQSGNVAVEDLLRLQNDTERFAKHLETITANPDFETVLVLTHAMFELPWDYGREGRDNPSSVPKLLVEMRLDRLVAVEQQHDGLSAAYFRALKKKGDVEGAKKALLDWTIDHRDRLVLRSGRFELKG